MRVGTDGRMGGGSRGRIGVVRTRRIRGEVCEFRRVFIFVCFVFLGIVSELRVKVQRPDLLGRVS